MDAKMCESDRAVQSTSSQLQGDQDKFGDVANTKKAAIWHYFTPNPTSTGFSKCNHCSATIKTGYGNTTGMRRHLENKHYAKYLLYKKEQNDMHQKKIEKQQNLFVAKSSRPNNDSQRTLSSFSKWDKNNPKAAAITREVGKWMVSSLHPYSLVDEEGLKKVLHLAQPLYNLPSSKTFIRTVIPKLYTDTKLFIRNEIDKQITSLTSLSITLDMWTSLSNESYLALTSHFMNENFELRNMCLGCYNFTGPHNGEAIAQKVNDCLREWELNNVTIPIFAVTDNARNMKLAMSLCKPQLTHLSCFAHSLQLALVDAKKETPGMTDLVAKVRKLVGHYKHSTQATERLAKIQKEMGKDELHLIQDCETRWNSEYLMLSRLLLNKEPVSRDLAAYGKLDNLTVLEWRLVEGYVDILEPLHQATTEVCSASVPTCSMVIPIIFCIEGKLKTYTSSASSGSGVMFARNLLMSIKSRFPNQMKVEPYITAMLIDPRFKDIALQVHERSLALHELKIKAKESVKSQLPEVESASSESKAPANAPKSLWAVFKKAAENKSNDSNTNSRLESDIEMEMKIYFSEDLLHNSKSSLVWWNENKLRFPQLYGVARQFLGIPATEVASERTFSSAGNIVTPLRERLTSCHVEELVIE